MFLNFETQHRYSFAVIGLSKVRSKTFSTRHAANQYMYDLCHKHGLQIEEVYNDNHDKTYLCSNGVTFYIHRV